MLEIKNIVKTYKPKNGPEVKALKSVSVKFAEKGLVFILGKSGCGKSTLLNCIGGLDSFDSGEIIIKGKSSLEFSGSDFDSYRNTFIGFIFQEYNILSEFNIEKNIALALELQGKDASREEVQRILNMVDLGDMGRRKTNELSGGQKQRVAIARALIKEPEIIIADEPTGALDSATGIQVFDTLKKLAQDKLVIVVSHDREFAEIYGDRIIEMKDGVIISDETKRKVEPTAVSDDLTMIGEDLIHIKKGHKFTADEKDMIIKFLESRDTETIISVDDKKNQKFKQVAKIDDNNHTEKFTDTTDEDRKSKEYNKKDLKLIKSRLKFKDAFKMGASGLKAKPVRLVFTILLSLVAFTLFGLVDTLSAYDKVTTTVNSIVDTNINSLAFTAESRRESSYNKMVDGEEVTEIDYYYSTSTLNDTDIAKLEKDLGIDLVGVVGEANSTIGIDSNSFAEKDDVNMETSYLLGYFSGATYMTKEELEALGFTIYGELPSATDTDKIAITEYIYKHYKFAGFSYYDGSKTVDIQANALTMDNNATTGIIGKKINFNGKQLTITGIVDTHFDYDRFADMDPMQKANNDNYLTNMMNKQELEPIVKYGYHGIAFVGESYLSGNKLNGYKLYSYTTRANTSSVSEMDEFPTFNSSTDIIKFSNTAENRNGIHYFVGYSEASMATGNKVIISINTLYNKMQIEGGEIYDEYWKLYYGEIDEPSANFINYFVNKRTEVFELEKQYSIAKSWTWDLSEHTNVEVVGFYIPSVAFSELDSDMMIISDACYDYINQNTYAYAIAPMPANKAKITEVIEYYYDMDADEDATTKYVVSNEVTNLLSSVNETIESMSEVFLYIGLAFCLFASLMLMNFIATSISYKKREIGILRAIGARKKDVFSIFFYEALVIALINFVLSAIGTFAVSTIINTVLREEVGLFITFLTFGIRQIVILLAVSVLVAFVSSLLPVYKIAKKQPIDAINNR